MRHYATLPDGTHLGQVQTQIMKEARYRYVGYDFLERKTNVKNKATLHVMVKRLVDNGWLEVENAGTTSVRFKATATPRVNK